MRICCCGTLSPGSAGGRATGAWVSVQTVITLWTCVPRSEQPCCHACNINSLKIAICVCWGSTHGRRDKTIHMPVRRYGRDFGGNYLVELVAGVTPRVMRVSDRQKDQLADLAVLNERLSGSRQPWSARQRLEYLKKQREQWEAVYEYLVKTDAAATMDSIEEAARNVSKSCIR